MKVMLSEVKCQNSNFIDLIVRLSFNRFPFHSPKGTLTSTFQATLNQQFVKINNTSLVYYSPVTQQQIQKYFPNHLLTWLGPSAWFTVWLTWSLQLWQRMFYKLFYFCLFKVIVHSAARPLLLFLLAGEVRELLSPSSPPLLSDFLCKQNQQLVSMAMQDKRPSSLVCWFWENWEALSTQGVLTFPFVLIVMTCRTGNVT